MQFFIFFFTWWYASSKLDILNVYKISKAKNSADILHFLFICYLEFALLCYYIVLLSF